MKKIYSCHHCGREIDTTKHAFVYSPKSGERIHLRCFVSSLTEDISYGLRKILTEEAKHEESLVRKRKKQSFH